MYNEMDQQSKKMGSLEEINNLIGYIPSQLGSRLHHLTANNFYIHFVETLSLYTVHQSTKVLKFWPGKYKINLLIWEVISHYKRSHWWIGLPRSNKIVKPPPDVYVKSTKWTFGRVKFKFNDIVSLLLGIDKYKPGLRKGRGGYGTGPQWILKNSRPLSNSTFFFIKSEIFGYSNNSIFCKSKETCTLYFILLSTIYFFAAIYSGIGKLDPEWHFLDLGKKMLDNNKIKSMDKIITIILLYKGYMSSVFSGTIT
ncbi:hypothetical protein AGLY_000044 [Aphis glycines]|uniref:Uncharacterized protein n=1 Tax=Aphis glycines TaxID=307491 RepID=A0A6G0U6D6_APHGL|nr:hypothetical protein AGLY_000044 [Aphis glycines]